MNKKEPLKIVHLFTLMYIDDMHTYKIWIYIFLYMIYIYIYTAYAYSDKKRNRIERAGSCFSVKSVGKLKFSLLSKLERTAAAATVALQLLRHR